MMDIDNTNIVVYTLIDQWCHMLVTIIVSCVEYITQF